MVEELIALLGLVDLVDLLQILLAHLRKILRNLHGGAKHVDQLALILEAEVLHHLLLLRKHSEGKLQIFGDCLASLIKLLKKSLFYAFEHGLELAHNPLFDCEDILRDEVSGPLGRLEDLILEHLHFIDSVLDFGLDVRISALVNDFCEVLCCDQVLPIRVI